MMLAKSLFAVVISLALVAGTGTVQAQFSRASLPNPRPATATVPAQEAITAAQSAAAASSVTPPLLIKYSGTSDAVTIDNTGTHHALAARLKNPANAVSTIYATTVGSGAAFYGINSGSTGPAAKFEITQQGSFQSGVYSTNAGHGPAVLGIKTGDGCCLEDPGPEPAILGQYDGVNTQGIGVQGIGITGVQGTAKDLPAINLHGIGVVGTAETGTGVLGSSSTGTGISGYCFNCTGVKGFSNTNVAVRGDSASGTGIYGSSGSGFAGYFQGNGVFTGNLTVATLSYSSDRNLKSGFEPVDGAVLLERISRLPITSWYYKQDADVRHIGPMAQDFQAAIGLGGDDRHISAVDAMGVSLVAIQELNRKLEARDQEIAALKRQLAMINQQFGERLAALEQGRVPAARQVVYQQRQ